MPGLGIRHELIEVIRLPKISKNGNRTGAREYCIKNPAKTADRRCRFWRIPAVDWSGARAEEIVSRLAPIPSKTREETNNP